ncbi:phage minor capsid protein [Actinopolyspora halophila]|uniref:phage minor capsid protein n=1 Tax=Actinopolyspora halophila TaxID=1850 RepID=UPI00037E47C7|nr:phage minor capsid protein [Actinopolyspora halophila]
MPVDPDKVDRVAATVAALYREAETALTREVARKLAGEMDRDMTPPEWADNKLSAVRSLRRSAQSILAGLQADSSTAIRTAAAAAFRAGWRSALQELPEQWFPESGLDEQARQAADQTPGFAAIESLANAVHEDIGKRSSNILRDVLDAYRGVVTGASSRALSGTGTIREAAWSAWSGLVDKGLLGFTDSSGRRWQLSSYVEMATRTVTQRAAIQGQTDRLEAAGVNLVYASDHAQECRLCRPYEGEILRLDSGPTGDVPVPHSTRDGETVTVTIKASLDGARAAGFQHPNCRHSVSAYLPGVTRLPEPPTADPEGDRARVRQRQIERQIRHYKSRDAAALDEQERKVARRKVRSWQAEMRQHLDDNPNLKRQRHREQLGAGYAPPSTRRGDSAGDISAEIEQTLDGQAQQRPAPERDDEQQPEQEQATPVDEEQGDLLADAPAELPNFAEFTDDALAEAVGTFADNETALSEVLAEMDRRQDAADEQERAEAEAEAERQRHRERRAQQRAEREQRQREEFERLVAEGHDEVEAWADATGQNVERVRRDDAIARLRDQGYTGRGFDELARAAYREHVDAQYWAAEDATNGVLLNRAGEAAGISPRSLFTGSEARARKYASDELKEFWDQNGRMTFTEYSAMILGNTRAAQQSGAARGDFLT